MTTPGRPSAEDVFDHAVDLPASARAAYLDAACAGDDALRAEVEALLAADNRAADGFLAGEADLGDLAAALAARAGPAPAAGDQVGAWRLLRELGAGGMGTVHLAERTRGGFAQQVAVKLVRPGLDTDEILARFARERQLLAGLEHPHIARLVDGGRTDDGRPFLVMEHVDGRPIDLYCDHHGLDVAARLRLFLDVCAAVAHAHRHLVVHRDLKPGNVLVTADGVVKLLDFGIAKVLDADDGAGLQTMTGARLHSPRYASPEQVAGRPVTTAADIYSLGVILYELLTGRSPYPGTDGSLVELERLVREHRPIPPSTTGRGRAGAAAVPDRRALAGLDADLDAIVLKTLRKEPERRYASVDALAEDVRRHLAGLPVRARPDSWRYRLGKFAQRHRAAVGVGAAALVLVAAAGTVGFVQTRRADQEQRAAAQIGGFLQTMLGSLDPDVARGQDTALLRGLLDEAATSLADGTVLAAAARADLHETIGRSYNVIADYDPAVAHLERALALRSAPADRRRVLADLGLTLHDAGRYAEAEARLREARDLAGDAPDPAVLDFRLGHALEAQNRQDEAEPLLRRAAAAVTDRIDLPQRPEIVGGLGSYLMYNHQAYTEAESLLTAALALCPATPGSGVLQPPTFLLALSTLHRYRGDAERAEDFGRRALAGYLAVLPADHPSVANAKDQLASILEQQERWDEAETLYREAYEALRASLGPDHRDVGTTANNFAGMLRKSGRPDEAAPYYDEAVRIYRAALGADHVWVGIVLGGVVANELERGNYAAAEAVADECLAIRRATFGPDHWRVAMVENMRGVCLAARGARDEAEVVLRASRDALHDAFGPDHEASRRADRRLAAFYAGSGEPSDSSRR
ncbi:serine/threonine protein kinase [bacterium]|nr:serine/threonine protein kinase [bacterium]